MYAYAKQNSSHGAVAKSTFSILMLVKRQRKCPVSLYNIAQNMHEHILINTQLSSLWIFGEAQLTGHTVDGCAGCAEVKHNNHNLNISTAINQFVLAMTFMPLK